MAKWGELHSFMDKALQTETDDCIIWPYALMTAGYGFFKVRGGGPYYLANRYVCEKAHGPPPFPRALALHSCDVRACVNKRHLRWGDWVDNWQDHLARG
jgi:hypothetical protein